MTESVKWRKEHKIRTSAETKKAMAFLESRGKKFFVNFGYDNAESVARTEFDFYAGPLDINTLNGLVLEILRKFRKQWMTPIDLCAFIRYRTGKVVSDSTASARLRDLRKPRYGAHTIEKRKREGSRSWEYRLMA